MDENEVVAQDTERLDKVEADIEHGREHLNKMTHVGEPEFYQDDETRASETGAGQPRPEGAAGDAAAPPPPG